MKDELIKDLENARKNLLEVISKLPSDFFDKWGKKELLAHFCGWDEEDVVRKNRSRIGKLNILIKSYH
ncbi:hypothetical protein C4577_05560 [Candidatus Parcubacteria bacterium]|nr:MAG: hypothetical protein C4577_05560 [Candidatus Parcubacteria bacterium]